MPRPFHMEWNPEELGPVERPEWSRVSPPLRWTGRSVVICIQCVLHGAVD